MMITLIIIIIIIIVIIIIITIYYYCYCFFYYYASGLVSRTRAGGDARQARRCRVRCRAGGASWASPAVGYTGKSLIRGNP